MLTPFKNRLILTSLEPSGPKLTGLEPVTYGYFQQNIKKPTKSELFFANNSLAAKKIGLEPTRLKLTSFEAVTYAYFQQNIKKPAKSGLFYTNSWLPKLDLNQ